jgi:hypothetical protein
MFAFAPGPAVTPEEKTENKIREAVSEAASVPAPPIELPQAEASVQTEAAPKVEELSQGTPVAARPEEAAPEQIPTEEELAEALRLLTPSQPQAETESVPRQEEAVTVPADVVQALEEAGQSAGLIGRWMAEAVALSPEEAAISLEAEMFQKFSMSPVAETPAPAAETTSVTPSEVAETRSAETGVEQTATPEIAARATPAEAEKKDEDLPAAEQQQPATTFADAIQRTESSEAESPSSAPVETSAAPEAVYKSSSEEDEAGGQDDMSKDKADKTNAAWSNWHQIRSGSTPAGAASDPVQAAKDAEAQAEEAPRAMAAAAAGDGSAASSDASDIANIVDSVLADLRPKIVEEIAKKLGKSKKG